MLTLPCRRRRRRVGRRRLAEPAAVLHHPARAIGLVSLVRAAVHVVLLFKRRLPSRSRSGRDFGIGLASAARFSSRRRLASRSQPRRPCAVASSGGSSSPRALAEALVLSPVDRVRLRQDLLGDLLVVEVLVLRGVRVQLRAVDREHRHADQTGVRAQRQHLAEQAGQRRLVALAKPRDRAVIGPLVRRDHPERDIIDAAPARSPATTAARSRTRRAAAPPSSPDRAPPDRARPHDKRRRTPPDPSPRPPSITNHARCPSGSHSRRLGGNNNSCSRSHARKFWAITGSS